jgi:hypothetical protein
MPFFAAVDAPRRPRFDEFPRTFRDGFALRLLPPAVSPVRTTDSGATAAAGLIANAVAARCSGSAPSRTNCHCRRCGSLEAGPRPLRRLRHTRLVRHAYRGGGRHRCPRVAEAVPTPAKNCRITVALSGAHRADGLFSSHASAPRSAGYSRTSTAFPDESCRLSNAHGTG